MNQQESGYVADEASLVEAKARERRRSSVSLALPNGADQQGMTNSVNIGAGQVEFEAHGVKINRDGLFIEGTNVSAVHQDDLRVLKELGRGACSIVKQAQDVGTRQLYALKVFSVFDREKRAQLLKEVETLWAMECPSLIHFVGGYLQNGNIHVILEFMDRGDLTDLIHGCQELSYGENLMAAVAFQMLWGLGYLHFEHHVHRDVKPQNVLLNSKGEVKLSDFGIARSLEGEMDLAQTMVGTIRYMSPERLAGAGYGVAADVWSLGVVLLEMAARRLPFDTTVSQIELHDRLEQELAVDDLIKLVPRHSPEFEEVLRGCLQSQPEDRLTPMELLELEWFRQFRRPAGQADENATEGEGEGSCTDSGNGGLEVGQEGGAGGGEDNDDGSGNETHDLDRAAQVVREYLLRAVESGLLKTEVTRAPLPRDQQCRHSESSGDGMIHTMCSDGSDSDAQGALGIDDGEHFGGFGGFREEHDEES